MNILDELNYDLARDVHGTVPQTVYSHDVRATQELLERLAYLEAGYTAGFAGQGAPPRLTKSNPDVKQELQALVQMECTDAEIADKYGVVENPIYRWRNILGIFKGAHLNRTIGYMLREYIAHWRNQTDGKRVGAIMTLGWLRSQNLPCTRDQVRWVLWEMEPDNVQARGTQAIKRRVYHVPFPNSIWHIDGHHKLIRWKMVIQGGIDGKSHLMTFMDVSDNNRAETVRAIFLKSTEVWGWPEGVRADHRGENLGVGRRNGSGQRSVPWSILD
ncbi:hypothetical protein QFC22_001895 [Naganishia vaughanmartiniae]|uniref:Uncharacterized protein n=1 Tax=Naganishia vaughanmartiniae TaxID=1424756 RepID=A0ACC2XEK4_9TREE|nr:hypothetical protein QFC22_001895 [Naganishia vaughanmartiniae]